MANYYMYTHDLKTIKKAENDNQVKPLVFRVNGELKNNFLLEELDSMTTLCSNEETLLAKLAQSIEYAPYINSKSKITIVHKYKGQYLSSDVVYDDKFLFKCAMEVRNRKANGEKENDIYLNVTKDVGEFISRMKNYLLNVDSYNLLMSDKNISSDPHMRKLMEAYNYMMKHSYLEPEQQNYLKEIEKKLNANLCKYKTLRKFVVWEKKYLNKEITPEVNYVQSEIDLAAITPIKEEKTDDEVKDPVLEKFYENQRNIKKIVPGRRYSLDELLGENNKFGRYDDPLTRLYNEGGSVKILNEMDLDEILRYSQDDLNAVGLGYLKDSSDTYEKRK